MTDEHRPRHPGEEMGNGNYPDDEIAPFVQDGPIVKSSRAVMPPPTSEPIDPVMSVAARLAVIAEHRDIKRRSSMRIEEMALGIAASEAVERKGY